MLSRYNEQLIKKDTEKIDLDQNPENEKKLQLYENILNKENKIFFKNSKSHFIIQNKSLFKIFNLLEESPVENVLFTYYIHDKSKEESKEEKVEVIYLRKKFKEQTLEKMKKEGSTIAKAPYIFQKTWVNLYPLEIILSVLTLGFLCYFYKTTSKFSVYTYESLNILLVVILFSTGVLGVLKFSARKLTSFALINVLLVFGITLNLANISMRYIKGVAGENVEKFLSENQWVLFALNITGVIISFIIIILNCVMTSFYKEYEKQEKEGALLMVDIV